MFEVNGPGPRHLMAASPERHKSALAQNRRVPAALSADPSARANVHSQIRNLHEQTVEGFGEAYLDAATLHIGTALARVVGDARG